MRLFKLALILALPLFVQAAQGPVMPDTPFKFVKTIRQLPGGTVDVDTMSMNALDSTSGRMVGAVIRVTLKQGIPTPLGPQAFTFVNAIVANCKQDTVTLLATRAYGPNGSQLLTMKVPSTFPKSPENDTPIDVSHTYLCSQKVPSSPVGSNTLPESYKSFWK